MKPTRIIIVIGVDSVLLPAVIFMAVSMYFHLARLNQSTNKAKMTPNAEKSKKWMARGAISALTNGCLYYVFSFLMYATLGPTQMFCHIAETLWTFVYTAHKLSLYTFIYYRVSTFNDFFTEGGWKRLQVFATIAAGSYMLLMLGMMIFYNFDQFNLSMDFCFPDRLGKPSALFLAGGLALVDFSISTVGIICFIQLLWCNPVLGQIAKKDPKVGESARNVVTWSCIALVSTLSMLFITVAAGHYGFIDLDVFVNSLCLCMQYPHSLTTLLELLFGWSSGDETAEMVRTVPEGER